MSSSMLSCEQARELIAKINGVFTKPVHSWETRSAEICGRLSGPAAYYERQAPGSRVRLFANGCDPSTQRI